MNRVSKKETIMRELERVCGEVKILDNINGMRKGYIAFDRRENIAYITNDAPAAAIELFLSREFPERYCETVPKQYPETQ